MKWRKDIASTLGNDAAEAECTRFVGGGMNRTALGLLIQRTGGVPGVEISVELGLGQAMGPQGAAGVAKEPRPADCPGTQK